MRTAGCVLAWACLAGCTGTAAEAPRAGGESGRPGHATVVTPPWGGGQPAGAATEPDGAESKAAHDARMKWWREARFGMFIHWGIYSVPAGVYEGRNIPDLGEWIMNNASIPVATYADYAKRFNPVKFNADEYVAVARKAGMKYIVLTSKHHDGFAMFKSNASPFNVVDATPFKRDIAKELETAAHRAGLRFGVYYSQAQDWHHPGGFVYGRAGRKEGEHWDPAQDGSFDDYLKTIAIPQARELLTNYKLDVLWWDTPGQTTKAQATPLHDLLKLQPAIVTNNRLMNTRTSGAFIGDTETPEQRAPATGFPDGRDFETCMTINGTWGYKSTDTNFKSTETLLRNLIDIASKGGNYLLNVGPTAEGDIPQPEVDRLMAMGKWLDANGEAIYASGPNPFPPPATAPASAPRPATAAATGPATTRARTPAPPVVWDWRATTKPGKIYVHIFQWPKNGTFTVPAIPGGKRITRASLLADPAKTALRTAPAATGGTAVSVPADPLDPVATVLCLEVS
jgi:alpha-L-fucosidase